MKLILENWNRFLLTEAKSLKNAIEAVFGPTKIEKTNTGFKYIPERFNQSRLRWRDKLKD